MKIWLFHVSSSLRGISCNRAFSHEFVFAFDCISISHACLIVIRILESFQMLINYPVPLAMLCVSDNFEKTVRGTGTNNRFYMEFNLYYYSFHPHNVLYISHEKQIVVQPLASQLLSMLIFY